ncbi:MULTISPECIES: hypothetical protein [Pseudomonas]|uniref:hypothetical protein n=1 Tax=Pseudomonas TaxID=286 RepID=UPI002579AD3A|nr:MULTISPECIES: hypothetical protein [Pseudomonas]
MENWQCEGSDGEKTPLANLRIAWPEVMDLGHGVEMGLIELLVMQIGVLLLALLLNWVTLLMSRSVLRDALRDWNEIRVLPGRAYSNESR